MRVSFVESFVDFEKDIAFCASYIAWDVLAPGGQSFYDTTAQFLLPDVTQLLARTGWKNGLVSGAVLRNDLNTFCLRYRSSFQAARQSNVLLLQPLNMA